MHLEVATLSAKDGDAAGLVNAMNNGGGCDALLSCDGCHSAKVLPGVENPGNVLFLIEWNSADVHEAAKASEGFQKFVQIAGPWFGGEGGGSMQHFDLG
jgi:quinol monooxygenase YgiN